MAQAQRDSLHWHRTNITSFRFAHLSSEFFETKHDTKRVFFNPNSQQALLNGRIIHMRASLFVLFDNRGCLLLNITITMRLRCAGAHNVYCPSHSFLSYLNDR